VGGQSSSADQTTLGNPAVTNLIARTGQFTEQEIVRVNDSEAKAIILEISMCDNVAQFQALPRDTRNTFLSELKAKGLSVRQIERLTGINRGLVQKA
jgi:hypothetical protein